MILSVAEESSSATDLHPDPEASARAAGLRYGSDAQPGIRRLRQGKGFRYVDPHGEPVNDPKVLERIRALALPPAWTDVWICPSPRGHIQATARDKKGRKQYRYHERWREVRDDAKYERMLAFTRALPAIREQIDRDLARPGLPREKVLATIVRLLERTLIRVGNEQYARENQSYGLTTLEEQHVEVEGSTVAFHFRGKGGKTHTVDVHDRQLSRIVRRLQDLPGQELFQYLDDDGVPHSVQSDDVNAYLREISGQDFTAKDFRTYAGTLLAAQALVEAEAASSEVRAKRQVARAIARVAERLGNTPAVCRRCYVHPAIINAYIDGSLLEVAQSNSVAATAPAGAIVVQETTLVALLQGRPNGAAEG